MTETFLLPEVTKQSVMPLAFLVVLLPTWRASLGTCYLVGSHVSFKSEFNAISFWLSFPWLSGTDSSSTPGTHTPLLSSDIYCVVVLSSLLYIPHFLEKKFCWQHSTGYITYSAFMGGIGKQSMVALSASSYWNMLYQEGTLPMPTF